MKRLALGILAHVDSGKTTLSEAMLYRSGQLRRLGRVDHRDSFLDTHELERDRGITIFAKQAQLLLPQAKIALLDTPGHVDFSAETERVMQALDYAVLLISGTDGVQSHTETLWRLLGRYGVPAFLFVNKMDLPGAGREQVMEQLRRRFGENCVDFEQPREALDEQLAFCGEELMEEYIGRKTVDDGTIARAVAARQVFPCCFGSALKLEGVDLLLSLLSRYTRMPEYPEEFSARVFKISEDGQGGRLTHMKITGGALRVRANLVTGGTPEEPKTEKVNQIRVYSGAKFTVVEEALPGEVCAVTGLTGLRPGDRLGSGGHAAAPVLQPVLTYRVLLADGTDPHEALKNLRRLEDEDPQLHVVWNETSREIHMQLMGGVQLEVLQKLILERFGMQTEFGQGTILYKETIAGPVEGVGHFEPLRHYAEVHLLMEPGEPGSGLVFSSRCREDDLDKNWQRLILTHLEEKTHLGVLTGSPITDMKITLAAGRAHVKHTEGGDFRQATYRAVRQGLKSAKSVLLEPWYSFRLEVPQENVGRAMADLQRMGARFDPPQSEEGRALISGSAPVSELRDYAAQTAGYTRGLGRLSCTLSGYEPCHNAEEVIAALGYNSEEDLENPADSIFCSHGAGVLVKWCDVPEHMHLESVLKSREEQEPAPAAERAAAAAYRSALARDAELMRIFERTYGPIRREPAAALHTPKRPPASLPAGAGRGVSAVPQLPQGPEYLLVDGYNMIFAWQRLRELAGRDIDAARSRLTDILCNYQAFRQCELILVFDAYKLRGGVGSVEKIHNIHVVYTREAETADMYIEKATAKLGKHHRVRVATSDQLEQLIILGHGALRISAAAFEEEVAAVEEAIRRILEGES
ncbi:MAG: TetM/TetW/TetO/TetS family tetracycline resistance ribosomal protection protein [Oscillospiraceae bacterium]|nr:TetM/TetW/TetO/TetS family tetracycline resistance ribosomal protection protein [Oscillospiraceae bacterium]